MIGRLIKCKIMKTKTEIEALANGHANDLEAYQRDPRGNHITGFIAGYTACQEEDRSISMRKQKPKDYEPVLYFNGVVWQTGHFVPSQSLIPDHITHWQPLPNPPKK